MIQLYGKLFPFVQLVYLLSVKQQKVPDATKTTKPEEVVDSVEDPAVTSDDDTDSDNLSDDEVDNDTSDDTSVIQC